MLMIDDDQEYLGLCTIILREDGHDVTACSDFNEGRRRLADDPFDALITDVRLGAFNGLHLIALAPPSVTKIAMSAFLDPVIRRDAEQAGARFIVKPTDCATISAVLPKTAPRGQAAAIRARADSKLTHYPTVTCQTSVTASTGVPAAPASGTTVSAATRCLP